MSLGERPPFRYDGRMPYRICGNTGLKLSALSLGFWHNFGGSSPTSEQSEMIHTAFDAGITNFDLANNYGPPYGSAENNVGKILSQMPRDEFLVSSKAGYDMWPGPYGRGGSRKHIIASLDQSLKRTGLEYFDIFTPTVLMPLFLWKKHWGRWIQRLIRVKRYMLELAVT